MKWGLNHATWQLVKPFSPSRGPLRIGVVGFISFLGGLAESAVLVAIAVTADALVRQNDSVSFGPFTMSPAVVAGVALGLLALRVGSILLSAGISARFSAAIVLNAQSELLEGYLSSDHPTRVGRPPGDLATVSVGHARFTGELGACLAGAVSSLCGILAFGGSSLVVNPLATVAIAGLGAVLLGAMRPLRRLSQSAAADFAESGRTIGQDTTEIESLHREIHVFGVAGPIWERMCAEYRVAADRFERVRFLAAVVPQLFQAAMLAAAIGSVLLIVGAAPGADLGAIGAVVLLLIRSMSATQQFVTTNQRIIELSAYTIALEKLLGDLVQGSVEAGSAKPTHLHPVELCNVSFSYDGTDEVLQHLNVRLVPGQLVGLVGPSGAGKSTLVELLLRLRVPTGGEIRCGGVGIDQIDPAEFARRVAIVPQRPNLVAGSVAENVLFFRDLPLGSVGEAIRRAHLEGEISELPNGMDTVLGPNDRSLSGGQQQRLTIARALAANPDVLVLDEPTSALDAASERTIRRTLRELADDRIVIVVAHRYSTLSACDRILVLQGGKIEVDAGAEEVVKQSAFFRSMVISDD